MVAAHTDLPVIGVPLTSSTSVAGGLDALLSIAQMPPGVPVACVGVDNATQRGGARRSHPERVIARYTRPEIGAIWTDEARFTAMRDVEVAAAEALDGPTPEDLDAIRAATFTVEAIDEREKILDHDTAAFVDVLAASAGPAGRWIHYGLTSSDVVDTGLALQLKRAGALLVPAIRALACELREKATSTRERCASAAPTASTPSRRRSGSSSRATRWRRTATRSGSSAPSGRSPPRSPARSARSRRSVRPTRSAWRRTWASITEPVSTQVVPRDRHAELLSAIALAGAGLERFATEIRHLQRTEVREVEEPFRKGQKGSSAMPHKRNPVVCERICGLARVLRGNAQVGLENVALWHERDITHSSAERIVLPDSTILLDQLLALTRRVVNGMTVHADRMLANLEITSGALFSQRVLLALVEGGMQRDDAYRIVQRLGQQAWDTQTPLRTLLENEGVAIDLDAVFDYGYYVRHVPEVLARLEVIPSPS